MSFLIKNFSRISLFLAIYVAITGMVSIVLLLSGDANGLVAVLLIPIVLAALLHAIIGSRRLQQLGSLDANLQVSAMRFQKIMEGVSQGVIFTDNTRHITTVNSYISTLLGIEYNTFIGQTVDTLLANLHANYDPNLARQEVQFTRHDGRTFWLEIKTAPLNLANSAGNVYLCMDITEYKQMLNTFHEREQHLRTIITNLPVILFAVDPQGIITLSEGAGLDLLGYKHGELVGVSFWELYKDRPESIDNLKRALEGATFTARANFGGVIIETIYSPLLSDTGAVLATLGVSIDVTKRVRADEERERLASIIDHSEDFIAISDLEKQQIQYVNRGGVRMSGHEKSDELVGKPITQFHKYDKEHVHRTMRSVTKNTWREETELIKKDGSHLPVEQTQFIIRDDRGVPYAMATIMSDITARLRSKQALELARDRALEASALKSEFLATMSHEIRTPMNGIIGMTELLMETQLDDEQREFSTIVLGEAFHLLNLINDILDFAKIEAGEVILEHRAFDLHEIVQNVHTLLNPNALKKDLDFMVNIAPQTPQEVVGDATRLRQVLINLAGNAIKFTETGRIRLRMGLASQNDDQVILRFEIEDTGIGISPADRQRMFQPFTQVDGSHTRKYGGTGLGLVVAKRLVQLMDGNIDYNSIEGHGTTFWFTAQFQQATGANQTSDSTDEQPVTAIPDMDLSGIRVLIVNNDERQTVALRAHLSQLDIQSHASFSVEDALEELDTSFHKGAPYDIAIIGETLTHADNEHFLAGFEKSISGTLTRLIYMGELDSDETVKYHLTQGFVTCLRAPVQPSSVRKAINTAATVIISEEHITERENLARNSEGTLLLVEDNPANRDVVLRQLLHMGYVTHAVTNGQEALRLLFNQANPYDLIFMDLQMPVMDGLETTRRIRQWEVQTNAHIPIIALTANAHQKDHETGIAAGMDDYITKPVTMNTLRTILAQWMPSGSPTGSPDSTDD